MAGHGSLIEIKHKWTIDDLMDSHEALDIQEEIERHHAEMARSRT